MQLWKTPPEIPSKSVNRTYMYAFTKRIPRSYGSVRRSRAKSRPPPPAPEPAPSRAHAAAPAQGPSPASQRPPRPPPPAPPRSRPPLPAPAPRDAQSRGPRKPARASPPPPAALPPPARPGRRPSGGGGCRRMIRRAGEGGRRGRGSAARRRGQDHADCGAQAGAGSGHVPALSPPRGRTASGLRGAERGRPPQVPAGARRVPGTAHGARRGSRLPPRPRAGAPSRCAGRGGEGRGGAGRGRTGGEASGSPQSEPAGDRPGGERAAWPFKGAPAAAAVTCSRRARAPSPSPAAHLPRMRGGAGGSGGGAGAAPGAISRRLCGGGGGGGGAASAASRCSGPGPRPRPLCPPRGGPSGPPAAFGIRWRRSRAFQLQCARVTLRKGLFAGEGRVHPSQRGVAGPGCRARAAFLAAPGWQAAPPGSGDEGCLMALSLAPRELPVPSTRATPRPVASRAPLSWCQACCASHT